MEITEKRTGTRGRRLALIAPGLIAIEAAPAPWAVQGSTDSFKPRLTRTVPGCSPARVGRLVQDAPAGQDHFSTKARSIT